jgi:hypothetical protein
MDIRRDKFLAFARRLALLTPALAACGGSTTNTATSTNTTPTSSASAVSPPSSPPVDATAGSGPCRCSWDTNQASAPRVCKKGEVNYEGQACIPGGGAPSYGEGGYGPMPVPGPLPPPDLSC